MDAHIARRLWPVIEPLHAVVYFAPELTQRAEPYGLPAHGNTYFACRAAPLGAATAPLVTASFFGFSAARVARSVPGAWELITPADALLLRREVAASALRRLLGDADVSRAASLAGDAVEAAETAGHPLAAANAALDGDGDPHAELWQALTTLREHRGDGHVIALVHAGVGPCESHVLRSAAGAAPADFLRASRGWTQDEWDDATRRLVERDLITADATLTNAGRELRERYEADTDRLAVTPFAHLGPERTAELHDLLLPLCTQVIDAGGVPVERGLGSPWPPPQHLPSR